MAKSFKIHPKIGIARVGNSPKEFYLGPEETGGLPIECDAKGNPVSRDGEVQSVKSFKDAAGAIKRQAAQFKIFEYDETGASKKISLNDGRISGIRWTVHLANKKAVWYNFSELLGDLTLGPQNSYELQHVSLRNKDLPADKRQSYIIDPGPRTVSQAGERVEFSRFSPPANYPSFSFPPPGLQPSAVNSLGEIMMSDSGSLVVLGGFGNAGGKGDISSFAGANDWFDDISDGYVLATVTIKNDTGAIEQFDLDPAWVIVGSPKYAPELVNIVTLDDCLFDVAVRLMDYNPDIFSGQKYARTYDEGKKYNPFAGFNPDYCPNYERDIQPIITRPQSYRWVANVPSMDDFSRPMFDTSDSSEKNRGNRERYFAYYRVPVPAENFRFVNEVENGPNQLFSKDGLPLMPLNSGDNSVTNFPPLYKFLTLTATQYFFMKQWASGKFTNGPAESDDRHGVTCLDREVIGNCVGGPFSPGIEVTWLMRNPVIYSSPYQIRVSKWNGKNADLEMFYGTHGLSVTADPQDGNGAEPGDLTKRMAIPWQADFFDCTAQTPNITNPDVNQSAAHDGIQVPPVYYVYWWPPQSPMYVIAGSVEAGDQVLDGYVTYPPVARPNSSGIYQLSGAFQLVPAGQQVSYQRGINSFNQMVVSWKDLGFIVNRATTDYPYFVETERNTGFLAQGTALGIK